MYWQEEEAENPVPASDEVVDVLFAMECRRLPVDHAFPLAAAIEAVIPWTAETAGLGVHSVHVAGSQNGWERPPHGRDHFLMLSRRTRLAIRVPRECKDRLCEELSGKTLEVDGCRLVIGAGRPRPLSRETTLFARHVVSPPETDEERFLAEAVRELGRLGIRVRKALCGKNCLLHTPSGDLHTRSLMLANLAPEDSLRLQQIGLGPHRILGCGLFLPHKGIDSAKKGG